MADTKEKPIEGDYKEQPIPDADRAVAIREEAQLPAIGLMQDPEVVVEQGRKAAKALMAVINSKDKPVKFNGKTYPENDDWVLIAQFYGVTAKVRLDLERPIDREVTQFGPNAERDGTYIAKGWESYVELVDKHGNVVGGASAECLDDEDNWGARPKYEWVDKDKVPEGVSVIQTSKSKYPGGKDRCKIANGFDAVPDFQRRSMAQTRASSRALAMRFKFVPVLAGMASTSAEEMMAAGERPDDDHDYGQPQNGRPLNRPAAASSGTPVAAPAPEPTAPAPGQITPEMGVAMTELMDKQTTDQATAVRKFFTGKPYKGRLDWFQRGTKAEYDEVLAIYRPPLITQPGVRGEDADATPMTDEHWGMIVSTYNALTASEGKDPVMARQKSKFVVWMNDHAKGNWGHLKNHGELAEAAYLALGLPWEAPAAAPTLPPPPPLTPAFDPDEVPA